MNLGTLLFIGVKDGRGAGESATQRLLTGKFLLTYREKRGKEKRENEPKSKENRKKGRWKIENGRRKSYIMRRGPFGSTKMAIFYQEKAFHVGKKIRKNDFAPSKKYSSYAPASFNRRSAVLILANNGIRLYFAKHD